MTHARRDTCTRHVCGLMSPSKHWREALPFKLNDFFFFFSFFLGNRGLLHEDLNQYQFKPKEKVNNTYIKKKNKDQDLENRETGEKKN